MSSEHTQVLSMQNGSWPLGQSLQSATVSHDPPFLPQLQPGASDATADSPNQIANVVTTRTSFGEPLRRRRNVMNPTMPNSTRPPALGTREPLASHVQPAPPD